MIKRNDLYYALNGLVQHARFSFRPIEAAMSGEIPMDNWSVDWSKENLSPCPSLNEVNSYLTDSVKYEIEASAAINKLTIATQDNLNRTAKERGYDDAIAITTYVMASNQGWKSEAQIFINWRDDVWVYAYGEFDKIKQGRIPIPTVDEFIAKLPVIVWP